jgi:hypothetical protein
MRESIPNSRESITNEVAFLVSERNKRYKRYRPNDRDAAACQSAFSTRAHTY